MAIAMTPQPVAEPIPSPDPQPAPLHCERDVTAHGLDANVERALSSFSTGRRLAALREARAALQRRPHDRPAALLARAAQTQLRLDRDLATSRAQDGRPLRLAAIPLTPAAQPTSNVPALLRVVSKRKNLITDDADWLERNGLEPVVHRGRDAPGALPHALWGHRLGRRFVHVDHEVAVYGPYLAITAGGAPLASYDAAQLLRSGPVGFDVVFAQRAGDQLIVQAAYNGYAEQSGGHNAYLAAFDVATGLLRWSSEPLVGGLSNFVIAGDHVISGYGFTKEPDHLFVHALSSGARTQKLRLVSGPDSLLVKNGLLHVRTYDHDYVLSAGTPDVLQGGRDSEPTPPPTSLGGAHCWAHRGLVATGRGDAAALGEAIDGYRREPHALHSLTAELDGMRARLDNAPAGGPLDLQRRKAVAVAAAPFARMRPRAVPAAHTPPPRLRSVDRKKASPTRSPMRPPFLVDAPFYLPPVANGKLPHGAPAWIPERYGIHGLRAVIPSGRRTLLVHGGRYLTSVRDSEVEQILDLEALRHPPRANPQWKEFAVQDVTYAQVQGDRIYVCNGGGSYAREVYGKKGFLTALDLSSGEVLWRSRPLVCNADFVLLGDYLVTGYGFTAEPDRLYVVRLADGKVVQKLPLSSAPDSLHLEGERLVVECYGHRHVFSISSPR